MWNGRGRWRAIPAVPDPLGLRGSLRLGLELEEELAGAEESAVGRIAAALEEFESVAVPDIGERERVVRFVFGGLGHFAIVERSFEALEPIEEPLGLNEDR